ncbi:hypothetical protein SERLA73DRAFT_177928 [Serpula lacrymans var. lacrymans S7.3]|uniref:Thioesterase domain-containing protein n=2 Tax=Serpula lacrymans var. lacrymans TaxID=341189 RepID=F8PPY4_SERL3|nr:uncharacterized protein SERLADRAFT_461787 [Serpula lacrymans var. lacrymans S7.9]EGO02138.1 hypothetical protein SERLA73DRAFT_177928 [Serpula lacrymans var. lacrymans S7.3]EGO27762.1 hypothetical protein SERLADRAFT_461787 [Serpula lacrymans var. lacrymans S7.9]
MSSDPLAFFRALPDLEVDHVKGNISLEDKKLNCKVMKYFVGTGNHFGVAIGNRLRATDINVYKGAGGALEAQMVLEIDVTEDMCNVYGTMHGACAALLIDLGASGPLVAVGIATGTNTTGMSQTMDLIFHNAPRLGSKLRIVNTSVTVGGRLKTGRSEIWDKSGERLYVSGTHSKVNIPPQGKSKKPSKL